jgi:ATPase subunit of ABC transporter with duplicated ATPase domains
LNALAGNATANGELSGTIKFGPRTSVGMFTQVNDRPEFRGRTCLDIVRDRRFDEQLAMKALGRYRIARQSRQEFETLSGGQKARLEILCLELDGFDGTVIAVSHDRAFLAQLDRFLMITDDGEVFALPDYDLAMRALAEPAKTGSLRLAETLT